MNLKSNVKSEMKSLCLRLGQKSILGGSEPSQLFFHKVSIPKELMHMKVQFKNKNH